MVPLRRKVFAVGMGILASVYEKIERITQDKFLSEQWYSMLSDLTDEQFKKAIELIVKTSKYAPTIADIREKAVSKAEYTPEEAWAIVYRDLKKYGYYNEPVYEDWKLEAAKNAIGWHTLCDMQPEEKNAVRAHFMRIYQSLVKREQEARQTGNKRINDLVANLAKQLAPSSNSQLRKPELKASKRG